MVLYRKSEPQMGCWVRSIYGGGLEIARVCEHQGMPGDCLANKEGAGFTKIQREGWIESGKYLKLLVSEIR
jgi:hypothetical protein